MSNRLVDFILKDIDRDSFLQVQYERLLVEYRCIQPNWSSR